MVTTTKPKEKKMFNEIEIKFKHADGRRFRAERGTVTFTIGKEPDHNMFVVRGKYDWGLHTTRDLFANKENVYDLINELTHVFRVSWLNSINDSEAYLLFSEEHVAHEGPLGIVNVDDNQRVLIFDDFFNGYAK